MSEHHRGAWGTREDAVWWPGAIATQDQQTLQHHQHIINQHHQQQQQLQVQQAQQIQHQVVQQQSQQQQQQHNDVARSNASNVSTQQFTYKMGKCLPEVLSIHYIIHHVRKQTSSRQILPQKLNWIIAIKESNIQNQP